MSGLGGDKHDKYIVRDLPRINRSIIFKYFTIIYKIKICFRYD